MKRTPWLAPLSLSVELLLTGCADESPAPKDIAPSDAAVNICNENVPDDHIVDGIPAYASCDAALASVYSNNGVNTRATSGGADWVRTQWAYGYQCTEYVQRYLYFRWKVDAIFDINAADFCSHPLPSNLVKTTTPVHGDVMVFGIGSCGAGYPGHVAVVDTVDTATSQVTIVDENNVGRGTYAKSCGTCYLHATANDGSAGTGGASRAGGEPGAGD
jgi:hypothetical protein